MGFPPHTPPFPERAPKAGAVGGIARVSRSLGPGRGIWDFAKNQSFLYDGVELCKMFIYVKNESVCARRNTK
jgi:hypothetical protein